MANKIENGDYVFTNGAAEKARLMEQVLQDLRTALFCRRGRFYPNKEFGSTAAAAASSYPYHENLLAAARRCLEKYEGVLVKNAHFENGQARLTIVFYGQETEVAIHFDTNL